MSGMRVDHIIHITDYDDETRKWFDQHPDAQTTVMKCDDCGLFYKPILGHKCNRKNVVIYVNKESK